MGKQDNTGKHLDTAKRFDTAKRDDARKRVDACERDDPGLHVESLEAILGELRGEMRRPGIAGQSQLHARLEDLEIALRGVGEMQREGAQRISAADRKRTITLLEECRRRLEQSHDVLAQQGRWVEARRASEGLEDSYRGKVGRGRAGGYGAEVFHRGALEAQG